MTLAVGRLVDAATGSRLGTVFAVTSRLALTAFHCVGDSASGRLRSSRLRCEWPESVSDASVEDGDSRQDVAVLRLSRALSPGLDPVRLTEKVTAHMPFSAPGYPADVPGLSRMSASGTIVSSSVTLAGEPVLQLACFQAAAQLSLHGMSGAPVLAGQSQRAVGMIRWNPPRFDNPDLAAGGSVFAAPAAGILRRWPRLSLAHAGDEYELVAVLRRLSRRAPDRGASEIRSDILQLLTEGGLQLRDHDLQYDIDLLSEGQSSIIIVPARTLVAVRADLRQDGAISSAERQIDRYISARAEAAGRRYLGILTDGSEWRLYHRVGGSLKLAQAPRIVDPGSPVPHELLSWIEAVLASGRNIEPTPAEIVSKLGADSPAYAIDAAELAAIYDLCRDMSTVRIKREMWAKLLTTASGTGFADDDALFVDHTLLVVMAEVIGHAVVDFNLHDPDFTAGEILSGSRFTECGIGGVVESDFFDWLAEVPEGMRFVKDLAERLSRFAWGQVQHDVMKILYQSIIPQHVRHRLGEYYTPDWLAEAIISECVADPTSQRVLDASCGSGTFLFHAIRRYLSAAESAGLTGAFLFKELTTHVIGFDVHPVAVTLARVTYLLAIGMERLRERPQFTVPVYLCDSLRWGQQDNIWSYKGLSVRTTQKHSDLLYDPEFTSETDFRERLKFPDDVIANAGDFDQLVRELADKAVDPSRGDPDVFLAGVFRRLGVPEDSQEMIKQTFINMCDLHDQDRDHIWGYYVRNLARPVWMARPDNRVDVLVGNPPWLAYRYMTPVQKKSFAEMTAERRLWGGAALTTSQDLAALFAARCIELYLKPEGRFGYVMPRGVLSLSQYERFRRGNYSIPTEQVTVCFDLPWDLGHIKPSFFTQSVCAVFGRRTAGSVRELGRRSDEWSGRFNTKTATLAEAAASIARTTMEPALARHASPYAALFSQGAAVVPQVLFLVKDNDIGKLGPGAGRRAVESFRSANEHMPWRTVKSLRHVVEERFIKQLYLGASILPFRIIAPREAVIPWDGSLLGPTEMELYPGLASWWSDAERKWRDNKPEATLGLLEQLDYRGKLSQQFPTSGYRVVYPKSSMYCAAAVIPESGTGDAVIDQQLYWADVETLDEARYVTAVLNAPALVAAVQTLQPRGEHNPRDIAKYVFRLPIPLYDPNDAAHQELTALAAHAETVAADVELPAGRASGTLRRTIRQALVRDGIAGDIDSIVRALLA